MAAPACGQRSAEPSPAEAASTPLIIPVVPQLESMEGGKAWENAAFSQDEFLIRVLLIGIITSGKQCNILILKLH